jgi:glycosyltransferase involved in cell wall biosynthesis
VQNISYPFDKRVMKEVSTLKNAGNSLIVISPTSAIDPLLFEQIDGVDVFRYTAPASDGSVIGFICEYAISLAKIYILFLKLYFSRKFEAVHVANPPDFFWPLALLGKLFQIKFIYDQHDLAPEMFRTKFGSGWLYKTLLWNERISALLADRIIVVNKTFKLRSLKNWNLRENKYAVIYNGPDEKFDAIPNECLSQRYRGKKILLYVGLMTVNDNIGLILEVVRQILSTYSKHEIHAILVGGGEIEQEMKNRAKQMGLTGFVEFTGIVNHERVMEFLGVADVCLAPDAPNGLNEFLTLVKILEYMKAGKPFVSLQLPETMEMAQGGGMYAGDVDEFASHITYLLDHPEVAEKLGAEGERIVRERYLWKHSEAILLGLYRNLWT